MAARTRIHCLRCRRDTVAVRTAVREGRDRYWVNKCTGCGLVYAAPDPARVRGRKVRRGQAALERAGQLPLAFDGGRRR